MTAHSMLSTDSSFAHVFAHGHPAMALGEREYNLLPKARDHGVEVGSGNGVMKGKHDRMTLFEVLARPENDVPRQAFAEGMIMLEIMHGSEGCLDFPWERWDEQGAVFVDVSHGGDSFSIVGRDGKGFCMWGTMLFLHC